VLSVLPFYVVLAIEASNANNESLQGISSVKILRVVRLFRILRTTHFFKSVQNMIACLARIGQELALFFMVISVLMLLSATIVYYCEVDEADTDFISIPASLWWALMTVTTTGYGDMVPTSDGGKLSAAITAAVGVVLLAIPGGIFLSALFDIIKEQKLRAEALEHMAVQSTAETTKSEEFRAKATALMDIFEATKYASESLRNAQLMEMQPSKKDAVEATVMALLKSVRQESSETTPTPDPHDSSL